MSEFNLGQTWFLLSYIEISLTARCREPFRAFKYLKNRCQALGWSHKEGPVPTSIVLPVLSSPQPAELGLYPKRLPWAPISVSGHVLLHLRLISPDLMPSTAHNTGLAHLNPKNQGSGKREVCTTQTEGQDGE